MVSTPPANIVAGFSRELNQVSVGPTTFLLTASGGDGTFGEANDMPITAAAITVGANPNSATFDLGGQQLADDTYRVSLLGNATASVLDLDGNMLDGEYLGRFPTGNLTAGGDFVVQFTLVSPLGATLDEIQDGVFTPTCATANCHTGANPSGGLDLTDADTSHTALFNVASNGDPTILRVAPGLPNDSYLVQKLEGTRLARRSSIVQVNIDAPVAAAFLLDLADPYLADLCRRFSTPTISSRRTSPLPRGGCTDIVRTSSGFVSSSASLIQRQLIG
jgi:hypothetical protein